MSTQKNPINKEQVHSFLSLTVDVDNITDYSELMDRWEKASSDSDLRLQIEKRMIDIITSINLDTPPEWFIELINGGIITEQPSFIRSTFRKKLEGYME